MCTTELLKRLGFAASAASVLSEIARVRNRTEIHNFTKAGIEIRVGAYGLAVTKKFRVSDRPIKR